MRSFVILTMFVFFAYWTQAQSTYLDSTFVAQPSIQQDTSQKKHLSLYIRIFTGFGELFSNNKHLSQKLSVPYTSTSSGSNFLTINKNNFVGNNFLMIGGGFEIGIGIFFLNIFPCGLLSNSSKYGKLPNGAGLTALGVNMPLHYKTKKFTLQIAAVLEDVDYDFSLGQINNTNTTIDILGKQVNPTFYHNGSTQKG